MATKKRPDVSWVNPDAIGSNKEKYKSAVQTISETTETKKDISSGPSLIAAVGAKYKQNPTADIAKFKKSFNEYRPTDTPISWRTTGGNIAKSKTVGKDYKTY